MKKSCSLFMSDGMGNECPVFIIELWLLNNVGLCAAAELWSQNHVSINYIVYKDKNTPQLPVWGSSYL